MFVVNVPIIGCMQDHIPMNVDANDILYQIEVMPTKLEQIRMFSGRCHFINHEKKAEFVRAETFDHKCANPTTIVTAGIGCLSEHIPTCYFEEEVTFFVNITPIYRIEIHVLAGEMTVKRELWGKYPLFENCFTNKKNLGNDKAIEK